MLSNYSLKKINKYKLKFWLKPWIKTGLENSISVKNKFLTNFIKKKDSVKKAELQYKNHRNLLSNLLKKVKKIIRNIVNQIGIMPESSGKVSNPL